MAQGHQKAGKQVNFRYKEKAKYLLSGGAGHTPGGLTKTETGGAGTETWLARKAARKAKKQLRYRRNKKRRHHKGYLAGDDILIEKRRYFVAGKNKKIAQRRKKRRREYRAYMYAWSQVCARRRRISGFANYRNWREKSSENFLLFVGK
jgi:hypothetical protein